MRSVLVVAVAICLGCAHATHDVAASTGADPSDYGPLVQEGYVAVRAATVAFRTLDSAVAVGYARTVAECFADSVHGAMGFHHLNSKYVDARLEVGKPEILLYERLGDGSYAFNGVEYIIPYRLWPRDSTPPRIMGLELHQSDDLKLWYKHMWAWRPNSAGLFANWNPAVACRG